MPKNDRFGQAAILTDSDFAKIRKNIISPRYKLLWDIARYTGERWGAIIQLQKSDVWDEKGKVRADITFRASTRKASPDGKRETRQVPVHPTLAEILASCSLVEDVPWIFPGRKGDKPIPMQAADAILRRAVGRAGLEGKGVSSHSTRRTFITSLHKNGVSLPVIQKATGHRDLKALNRYIDVDPEQVRGAITTL
jgi:integrase/recombinase XerD